MDNTVTLTSHDVEPGYFDNKTALISIERIILIVNAEYQNYGTRRSIAYVRTRETHRARFSGDISRRACGSRDVKSIRIASST